MVTSRVQNLSPEQVEGMLKKNEPLRVVDVRMYWEYEQRHIPGSLALPLDFFVSKYGEHLAASDSIVVVCEHGVRSGQAARFLAQQGFLNVSHMVGGLSEYDGPTEGRA